MPHFDPLPYAIPVFVALIAAEIAWARRSGHRRAYETRDTAVSLALGLGSTVAGAAAAGMVAAALVWAHAAAPLEIGWSWWAWPLCFVLDDLAYYWFHRTAHRIRWFWAAHVTTTRASTTTSRRRCDKPGPASSPCRSHFACRWRRSASSRA